MFSKKKKIKTLTLSMRNNLCIFSLGTGARERELNLINISHYLFLNNKKSLNLSP